MNNLSFQQLKNIQSRFTLWLNENFDHKHECIIIISYGNLNNRCQTKSIKEINATRAMIKVKKFLEVIFLKNRSLLSFLKFDVITNKTKISKKKLLDDLLNQKHNNHYRKGISLDENFNIFFLEQEIYGRAIITSNSFNEANYLNQKHLNNAIKEKYKNITMNFNLEKISFFWIFETKGIFFENGSFFELQSCEKYNGIRRSINTKEYIREIITKNSFFLHDQIQESGKFIYGYFPAFNNKINSYNTVRHCTSVYALLETLEINYKEEFLLKINSAIKYSINEFFKTTDEITAHMIDLPNEKPEIKLGANAAAVLMLCKYQEITNDAQYLSFAEKIANGILSMINNKGKTTHVLNYPSLDIKENFRIIYYDGEAALALLRLYQLNKNKTLLETVKLMFNHFITNTYENHHDHWLSYCANELTMICPDEKYYLFGIKNYLNHMNFIKNRETAYATFLEMMMSAYKMVTRLKQHNLQELFEYAEYEKLKNLIKLRADFQLTGFFYPEVAMYMKKPYQILNSFYVRHDRFRTRIDDQEHNLSGYIAYYLHFKE